MPKGTPAAALTPGENQKHYLAGAWDSRAGVVHSCAGPRKTNALFRSLPDILETRYPARRYDRIYIGMDNYKIHKAQAVERWLAVPPRFELLWLPAYCPRANPIERIFGDAHGKVTRNHKRKPLRDLAADASRYLDRHGPWDYRLSAIYQEPEVTAALRRLKRGREVA